MMTEQEYITLHAALKRMRLSGMAEELKEQFESAGDVELSTDERIRRMIQAESTLRDDKKIARIVKAACFKYPQAAVDTDIAQKQGADSSLLESLSSCDWISRGRNLLITGKTGSGKSYCACALGVAAAGQFMSVRYIKASELLRKLESAETRHCLSEELNCYAKYDLLIVDDFGLMNLNSTNCRNLFELIDTRLDRKSTIFVSQLPVANWYNLFQDDTYADACLDRLTGNSSYRLSFDGESLRRRKKL